MPCRDYPEDHGTTRVVYRSDPDELKKIVFLEAALCAVISSIPVTGFKELTGKKDPFHMVDFDEAGVSRKELEAWWAQHQAKDKARREREARVKAKEVTRKKALAKLTPRERKALGLGPK